jgi:NTE family protein
MDAMSFTPPSLRSRLPVFRSRGPHPVPDAVDDELVDAAVLVEAFSDEVAHALDVAVDAAHAVDDDASAPPDPIEGDVLVLSGGGLHGAVQAGMLRALARTDWRPSLIVGVSAGALNGTYLGHHFTAERADALAEVWRGFDARGPFPARTVSQLWKILSRSHAVQDGAALRAVIDRCCPVANLSELATPVHIGATDLVAGAVRWFERGPAADVLYASAAIPGLVPPIEVDGVVYVDGGVIANVPVSRAVDLGARRILALDVSADPACPDVPTTALGVLLRSFSIARNATSDERVATASAAAEIWRVRPELPRDLQVMDWHRCSELVELGQETMRAWLEEHPRALAPPAADPIPLDRWPALRRWRRRDIA